MNIGPSTYNSHHKVLVNLQASNMDALKSKSCVLFCQIYFDVCCMTVYEVVFIFTARRIASAVLATAIPSVRLSVRMSHACIVSKRRHVARCSLHCQIAKCV